MFKLISFIGTGNYEETTYQLNEFEVKTRYFPVVAATLTQPDEIMVVKTKAATEKHWEALNKELSAHDLSAPVPVDIPGGETKEELWEIFNILIEEVQGADRVAFDITHSFRSLPLVSFLSVAYLKFVKNVNVEALYYGAYDAGDKTTGVSPVFDLTGFCSLLDWIVAVNSFINHGTAREVGQLLVGAQKKAKAEQGPARRELNNFGNVLDNISRALFTNRPMEVTRETRKLKDYMQETEKRELLQKDVREWAAPFGILMDKVISTYSCFMGESNQLECNDLERHLEITRWYVKNNYAPQALSMMRETAISLVMCRAGQKDSLWERDAREETAAKLYSAEKNTVAYELWSRLAGLRNDVIHTGWRKEGARDSKSVMEQTRECLELLEKLFYREEPLPVAGKSSDEETIKVLVTPLGMSPGLLYTALIHIKPDHALVVTSVDARSNLQEIIERAGYHGKVEVLEVSDPFAGFDETSRVTGELVTSLEELPGHHLYINLTGGTTLLQHMVSRLSQCALDNCREKTTVAMIDRRSSVEQKQNPFVQGQMLVVE